jgi:hypothetical protein
MDLQTRKISFIRQFLAVQSEEIVIQLERLLKKELKENKARTFSPMSVDELNKRLDTSLLDAKEGRIIENSLLQKEIQTWS